MHVCAPVTEHSSVRHIWGGPLMSEYKCSNLLILTAINRVLFSVYDHSLRRGGDSVTTHKGTRRSSVIEHARGHLLSSTKRGSNELFCNEVCFCVIIAFVAFLLSPHFQGKLLHMLAGMRMSWEAQSMNIVVAKASPNLCATSPRPSS